jgi:hypothetical protein
MTITRHLQENEWIKKLCVLRNKCIEIFYSYVHNFIFILLIMMSNTHRKLEREFHIFESSGKISFSSNLVVFISSYCFAYCINYFETKNILPRLSTIFYDYSYWFYSLFINTWIADFCLTYTIVSIHCDFFK